MIFTNFVGIFCFGLIQISSTTASGLLHVEVLSYTDPGSLRNSQLCCDGDFSKDPSCAFPCDIFLSICITKENLKSRFPKGLTDADKMDCLNGQLIDAHLPKPPAGLEGTPIPVNLHFRAPFEGKWQAYQNIRLQLKKVDRNANLKIVDRFSVNYFRTDAFDEGPYTAKTFTATGIRPNSTAKIELRVAAVCDYSTSHSVAPHCEKSSCVPTDDCTGHYSCHPVTDKKVCLSGWTGPKCNQRSPTSPNCATDDVCLHGGECMVNGSTPEKIYCCCTVGWKGQFCEIAADLDFSKLLIESTSIADEFLPPADLFDAENDNLAWPELVVVKKDARRIRQVDSNSQNADLNAQGRFNPQNADLNAQGRVLLVPTSKTSSPGFVGHRPSFNANSQSDPQILQTLQLVRQLQSVDTRDRKSVV